MYGLPELSSPSRAPMLSLHLFFLSYSGVQELSALFLSHEPQSAPSCSGRCHLPTAPIRPPPLLSYATAHSTCSVHLLCSSSSKARQRAAASTGACAGGTAAGVARVVGADGTTAVVARAAPRVAWRGQLGEGLARGEFADGTSRQIEGVRTGSLALVGSAGGKSKARQAAARKCSRTRGALLLVGSGGELDTCGRVRSTRPVRRRRPPGPAEADACSSLARLAPASEGAASS
ncbi:hypothetical protein PVAP13_2KG583600 [Panicum virgatum]|uniref:Uncharacterized protein n=1 Tax=Panicum virgatum TaxID=38727 RepID=A0A8T0WDL3_PANVG|nr:hypothetical protein PVAP13_2KG583600 [Panicum virgatum]